MSRSLYPRRLRTGACLLCALPFALATLPQAEAQDGATATPRIVPAPNVTDALRRAPLQQAVAMDWRIVRAETTGMRDAGRAAPQPALSAVHGLRGFKLQFENGDHKLRRIGVVGEGRFVTFALADGNGDDPFLARAEFVNLSAGQMAEVAGIGGGKFEIPLPAGPAGHVPVLAGFEFRRADGSDANLRNIGLWLDSERGVARVSLVDDQGLDLRGLQETIGATIAAAVLPGVMEWAGPVAGGVAPVLGSTIGGRVVQQHYAGQRGYQVRVRYAWIPRTAVQSFGALAGTDRDTAMPANWQGSPRVDLLQGFEFTFMNSDHHLLALAVNDLWPSAPPPAPAPAPLLPRTGGTPQGQAPLVGLAQRQPAPQTAATQAKGVVFQDNNKDDPVQWSYTYVTLRGNATP
mgnify:CR=1 FL=1